MTTRENETQGSGAEPPVIDLEAEELAGTSESAAPEEPRPHTEEPPRGRSRPVPVRAIAVTLLTVVAVIAGALAFRSFGERLWPSERMFALEKRLAALDASASTLNVQMTAVGSSVDALKAATADLPGRVDNAVSAANSAAEQVKGFDERLGAAETDLALLQEGLFALKQQMAGGGGGAATGPAAVGAAELEALAKRVTALEETIAAIKSAPPAPAAERPETAALSQALADLKAKLASGVSYEAEAQTIERLVPGVPALGRLAAYASSGLPTAAGLASEVESLAVGLRQPEAQTQAADAGYWSDIGRFLGSIVRVRTIGEVDWKDLCAKSAVDARAGHLAQAVSRLDENEAVLPPELVQWRDKAKARIGADAAVEDVSSAVLRVIAGDPAGKS
jgi:hypothetical protein